MKKSTRKINNSVINFGLVFLGAVVITFIVFNINKATNYRQSSFASTDCSNTCTSFGQWRGTTQGARTKITISNPRVLSGNWFSRYVEMANSDGSAAYIGIDNGYFCNRSTVSPFYFYASQRSDGTYAAINCQSAPSYQVNTDQTIEMNNFVSGGGGMLFHFPVLFTACGSSYYCYVGGVPQTYANITMVEYIRTTFSGRWVWGSHWINNQYRARDGSWHSQTRDFDSRRHDDPPQFYWNIVPSSSNPGGELYSCDYDTGSTCTFGK